MIYVPQEPEEDTLFEKSITFCEEQRVVILVFGFIFGLIHILAYYLPVIGFANSIWITVLSLVCIVLGLFGFIRYGV